MSDATKNNPLQEFTGAGAIAPVTANSVPVPAAMGQRKPMRGREIARPPGKTAKRVVDRLLSGEQENK